MTVIVARSVVLIVALAVAWSAESSDKVVKETFGSGGRTRTYYILVPEKAKASGAAPLLVLLHGSGRDGKSLTGWWEKIARDEGIVIVAPDAAVREGWGMVDDGPDFLYNLVEMVRVQYEIDPRRIYLFGHSAGATHGLLMGLLEPDYFAAVAVHAGALPADGKPFLDRPGRRIPMGVWVGTEDARFPLSVVRATKEALTSRGFPVQLTEIPGHTHDYYSHAPGINQAVWSFLQKHRLAEDPQFQRYTVTRH